MSQPKQVLLAVAVALFGVMGRQLSLPTMIVYPAFAISGLLIVWVLCSSTWGKKEVPEVKDNKDEKSGSEPLINQSGQNNQAMVNSPGARQEIHLAPVDRLIPPNQSRKLADNLHDFPSAKIGILATTAPDAMAYGRQFMQAIKDGNWKVDRDAVDTFMNAIEERGIVILIHGKELARVLDPGKPWPPKAAIHLKSALLEAGFGDIPIKTMDSSLGDAGVEVCLFISRA